MKRVRLLMLSMLLVVLGKALPGQTVPEQTQPEVFNVTIYEGIYPDLLNAYGANTNAATSHWLNQGLPVEGRRASFIFDPQYYIAHNPGVPTTYAAALHDFLTNGLPQGKRGSLEFDVKWYLAHYSDLAAAYGTNYLGAADHFIGTGLPSEGRQGSADFSVQAYINMYPDVNAGYSYRSTFYSDAMMHWLRRGKALGRHGFGSFPINPDCSNGQTTEFDTVPATTTNGVFNITVGRASSFTSDAGVLYVNPPAGSGAQLTQVGSNPARGQYAVTAGVYTFNSADKEQPLQITYNLNPVPSGYQRIFFADPAQFHGTFGNGSSASSPLHPDSFTYSTGHQVSLNMDYVLRCRVEGGSDCTADGVATPPTNTQPVIVCLAPGTYLTNGTYDSYFNNHHTDGSNLGFTIGAGWKIHGAGMGTTTLRLNSVLTITQHDSVDISGGFPVGGGYNVALGTHDDASDNIEVSDMLVDLNYPGFHSQNPSRPLQLLGVQLRSNKGGHNIHHINFNNYASDFGGQNGKFEAFPIWILSVAPVGAALSKNNQIKWTLLGGSAPPPAACTGITLSGAQGEIAYNVSNGWSSIANNFGNCQGYGGWSLDNAWFHDNFAFNNISSFLTDSLTNRNVTIEFNEFNNPNGWGMVIGGGGRYDYYTIQWNNIDLGDSGTTGMVFQGDVTGANVNHNNITVAPASSQNSGITFKNNIQLSLNVGNDFQFNQISSRAPNSGVPANNCVFDNWNEQGVPLGSGFPDTQSSACASPSTAYLTMQTDGNLVVYGNAGAALWASNTGGTNASIVLMQNDGNLVVYQEIWQAGTYAAPTPGSYPAQTCSLGGNTLGQGQKITSGKCLVSTSGQYMLYMDPGGNFFIYDIAHNTGTWGPGTQGHTGAYAIMQTDGNFVVYDSANNPLWSSATNGSGADILRMEDDGRIILYKPVWSSVSNQTVIPPAMPHPPASECTDVGEGTGWTGVLPPGNCFVSPNGVYELIVQPDGALVIYDRHLNPHNPIWTNTLLQ